MKYLVLGSCGMAGHMIALYLQERGHDVTGLARRKTSFLGKNIVCDVTHLDKLKQILDDSDFDVVVNAIGVLNSKAEAQKASAVYLNSFLPHYLVSQTSGLKTRVFQLSTDCVFRGNTGPYDEETFPDGTSFYDRTKALGEIEDSKHLTLRQSIIGPDMNKEGIGLLNWFLMQDKEIEGYQGAIWTGLTTLELAKAIEKAAEYGAAGLVNVVPNESISKYELLKLCNLIICKDTKTLCPTNEFSLDKALTRTRSISNYEPLNYEAQIQELNLWIRQHSELYSHYPMSQWEN